MSIAESRLRFVILLILIFSLVLIPISVGFSQETVEAMVEAETVETETEFPETSDELASEPTAEPTVESTAEPTVEPTATLEPAIQKQVNLQSGAASAKVAPISLTESELTYAESYSSLEEVIYLRTENPYKPNTTRLIKFSLTGAEKLKIRFESDFNLESGYDIFGIYVYDAATNDYRLVDQKTYTKTDLAGQTVEIDSDSVVFRFESDGDVESSGWCVAGIDAEIPEETTVAVSEPAAAAAMEETAVPTETGTLVETEPAVATATPEIESMPTATAAITMEIPTVTAQPTLSYPSFYVTNEMRIYGHESFDEVISDNADPRSLGAPTITKIWKEDTYDSQTGVTAPTLKIRWSAVSEATGYRVWFSTVNATSGYYNFYDFSRNTNTVTLFNACPNTTFYFRVAALQNGTVGPLSNPVGGRINIGQPTLSNPVRVTAAQVRLSWSAVPGATGYRIWRSNTSATSGYTWAVTVGNVTSVVTSIQNSTSTYYYRVAAVVANMVGPLSPPKSYRASLPQPVLNPIMRVSASSLRVSWTAVPGATGYRLWRSETSPTSGYNWAVNVGNITAVVTNVSSTKTYYYRVAALSGSTVGPLSVPVAGTTALGKPNLFSISNVSEGGFRVSWSAVPGATSYILYRSETSSSSGYTWAVNVGNKTSVVTKAPNIYKRYYYRVAAVFNGQLGPLSNVVSAMYNSTTFRAMSVGEGAYPGDEALYGTVGDSIQVANAFRQFRLNGTGFARINRFSDLTKTQIFSQIASTFVDADSNDVSLFYFSGHGVLGGGIGYLYTVDQQYLSSYELRAALDNIPGTKYVLIDACHSGSFIGKSVRNDVIVDANASADTFASAFTAAFTSTEKRIDKSGYFVITASHSTELSWEYIQGNNRFGIFTYYLLEGIGWSRTGGHALSSLAADANGNKLVTFTEAYSYAYAKVKAVQQNPVQSVQMYPSGTSQLLFTR